MSLSAAELDIPDEVNVDGNPVEMIRFWICDAEDHVTLRIGTVVPDEEPEMWGSILADIAAHAIRGMQQDAPELGTADELLARIEVGYRDRIAEKPELQGQLRGSKN